MDGGGRQYFDQFCDLKELKDFVHYFDYYTPITPMLMTQSVTM